MSAEATPTQQTILVVDDDQDVALVLEGFLEEAGFRVDLAYDGLDALSRIHSHPYDAVVCDMMMPRMSGEELYREVERTAPWMLTRFLFITGMTRLSDVQRFFSQTGVRYLEKPFHPDEVLQTIREIVQENRGN